MKHLFENYQFLVPFLEFPETWFHLRGAAKQLGTSAPTLRRRLNSVFDAEVLKFRKENGFLFIQGNRENQEFKRMKIYHNLETLFASGLILHLSKFFWEPTVILFGSKARGEDVGDSDFDIAVICKSKKMVDTDIFEKKLNSKLQLFVFTETEWKKMIHSKNALVNSIANGIVLSGQLEVVM